MLKTGISVCLNILVLLQLSDSAKIFAVYPIPSISHQMFYRNLTLELIKRGHELTVITTDPIFNGNAPTKLREIDVHNVSYESWKRFFETPRGNSNDIDNQLRVAYECIGQAFEKQLQTDKVKNMIKNKNETFDLLIFDGCVQASLIFTHIYKIPAIQMNSLGPMHGDCESIGAFVNEAYYPSVHFKDSTNHLERFLETAKYYYEQFFYLKYIEKVQNEVVKKALGSDFPEIRDLKVNIDMLFVNMYAAWDWHRPAPMSLKYTGGLHSISEETLPEDLKSHLDGSTNGVIYMSFGPNVLTSALSKEKVQIFNTVFSQLPYNVILKWDLDTMANKSKNIKLFKWLPQSDVLKHPKVKLFITQGGLQSTEEAIAAGVPLIGIPMLFDQWSNTEKYKRYGIGLQLDFSSITEDTLTEAIRTVTGNKSYYSNIVRHRNLMNDQPRKVLDHAIYWIEHVIRHGGSHIRAPAANMPWAEYVELELVAIVLGVLTFCITGPVLGIKYMLRIIRHKASIL